MKRIQGEKKHQWNSAHHKEGKARWIFIDSSMEPIPPPASHLHLVDGGTFGEAPGQSSVSTSNRSLSGQRRTESVGCKVDGMVPTT